MDGESSHKGCPHVPWANVPTEALRFWAPLLIAWPNHGKVKADQTRSATHTRRFLQRHSADEFVREKSMDEVPSYV